MQLLMALGQSWRNNENGVITGRNGLQAKLNSGEINAGWLAMAKAEKLK
jgi:hypothetical protein